MTEVIEAIILGVVQGLTELLPVSSSAHLKLIPFFFKWTISDSFDIALHFGTLLAICIFFFKDWINLIKGGFNKVFKKEDSTEGRIFWYIVAATIPAGIIGLIFEHYLEGYLKQPLIVATALIVMGILLYVVDKKSKSEVSYENINNGFLGIYLEKGNYDVEITYKSPWLNIGKLLSFIGIISFITIVLIERKNKIKK